MKEVGEQACWEGYLDLSHVRDQWLMLSRLQNSQWKLSSALDIEGGINVCSAWTRLDMDMGCVVEIVCIH